MTTIISIVCDSCLHTNKQKLGMPGFEVLPYEFFSFSEAYLHMYSNPHHYMTIQIKESEDE